MTSREKDWERGRDSLKNGQKGLVRVELSVQEESLQRMDVLGLQTVLRAEETIKKVKWSRTGKARVGGEGTWGKWVCQGLGEKSGPNTKPSFPSAGRNPEMM